MWKYHHEPAKHMYVHMCVNMILKPTTLYVCIHIWNMIPSQSQIGLYTCVNTILSQQHICLYTYVEISSWTIKTYVHMCVNMILMPTTLYVCIHIWNMIPSQSQIGMYTCVNIILSQSHICLYTHVEISPRTSHTYVCTDMCRYIFH